MEERSIDEGFRQNKAFKQRIAYWQGKGFQPEEAYRRACVKNQLLSLAPRLSAEEAVPKTCRAKKLDGLTDGTKTWNAENLPRTVQDGLETLLSAAGPVLCTAPPASLQRRTETCRAENLAPNVFLTVETLHAIFCAVIVLGASALLVRSSAAVFGASWEGWLKAGLLELGIVGLSVHPAAGLADFLLSRGGALILAALSLFVLHTGVKNDAAQAYSAASASSDEVQELGDERRQLLQAIDALPQQHVTRREATLAKLRENSDRLQVARVQAAQSAPVEAVERRYDVEAFTRIVLMFLNVVFAHWLARKLASLEWTRTRST